jgi:branched-chain amino acid transport system ATP-binding protein
LDGVEARYGAVHALHGVSAKVGEGETVALLGTNGNGKSSLLRCIAGLLRCSAGEIRLHDDGQVHKLHLMSPQSIVQLGIALVPEGRKLFPHLTVRENLTLGAYRSQARRKLNENLELCFDTFPVLKQREHQPAGSMSGGQQQMLAIGRALMSSPRILLLDEPSVGLAPIVVAELMEKIAHLKARFGLTVLMAEQNFNQTIRVADRGYVIVHGAIADQGTAAELQRSDLVRKYYLGK